MLKSELVVALAAANAEVIAHGRTIEALRTQLAMAAPVGARTAAIPAPAAAPCKRWTDRLGRTFEKRVTYLGNRVITRNVLVATAGHA